MCAEITLCGHHLRPSPFPSSLPKKTFFTVWEAWAGHTSERTRVWEAGQDTHDDGHVGYVFFFYKTQCGPAPLRTSAARRASSCTTAPASCRRPGTRTRCRSSRHPTPRAPAYRDERPKSCVWAKGRLNVRSTAQKKNEGTFNYRNKSSEGIILHYSFILIQKNRNRVKLQILQFYINSKISNCNTSNL